MTDTGHAARSVPRAWRRAAPPRLSGTALFAQRVAARYGRAVRRVEQLQLPLVRPNAATLVQRFAGRTENHFGVTLPTLVVRVEPDARAAPAKPAAPAAPAHPGTAAHAGPSGAAAPLPWPAPAMPVRTASPVTPPAAAPHGPAAPDAAMPLAAPGGSALASVAIARTGDEMPVVAPRAAPAQAAPATLAPASTPAASLGDARGPATATGPAEALPAHQVERIADLVIGSLDRRILAERERRGGF